ncbi:MAG: hypothetical protein EOR97_01455 [Mesorhizobium sp.]|uniref:hypothetical protein n=1 Tax=Mesorhizobium sp. TaxID=1871066 RepID=UPI000FE69848|nr:hypothetical protein [Mesorhizobium sp.]RWN35299.1 MAG: hypothetical protein EOR97_01455 [Mesorhizobium sp.]
MGTAEKIEAFVGRFLGGPTYLPRQAEKLVLYHALMLGENRIKYYLILSILLENAEERRSA